MSQPKKQSGMTLVSASSKSGLKLDQIINHGNVFKEIHEQDSPPHELLNDPSEKEITKQHVAQTNNSFEFQKNVNQGQSTSKYTKRSSQIEVIGERLEADSVTVLNQNVSGTATGVQSKSLNKRTIMKHGTGNVNQDLKNVETAFHTKNLSLNYVQNSNSVTQSKEYLIETNRLNHTEGSLKEGHNNEDHNVSSMRQSQMNPRGTLYGGSRQDENTGEYNFPNLQTGSESFPMQPQKNANIKIPLVESVQTLNLQSGKGSGDIAAVSFALEQPNQQSKMSKNSSGGKSDVIDIITKEESKDEIITIKAKVSPKNKQTTANIVDLNSFLTPNITRSPQRSGVKLHTKQNVTVVSPKAFLNPTQRERRNKFKDQSQDRNDGSKNETQKQFIGLQAYNINQIEQLDQMLIENRLNVLQASASGKFQQIQLSGDQEMTSGGDTLERIDIGVQGQSKQLEPLELKFVKPQVQRQTYEQKKNKALILQNKSFENVKRETGSESASPRIKTAHLDNDQTQSSNGAAEQLAYNSKLNSREQNRNEFDQIHLKEISNGASSRQSKDNLSRGKSKIRSLNADLPHQKGAQKGKTKGCQPKASRLIGLDETSKKTEYMMKQQFSIQSSADPINSLSPKINQPINVSFEAKDGSSTSKPNLGINSFQPESDKIPKQTTHKIKKYPPKSPILLNPNAKLNNSFYAPKMKPIEINSKFIQNKPHHKGLKNLSLQSVQSSDEKTQENKAQLTAQKFHVQDPVQSKNFQDLISDSASGLEEPKVQNIAENENGDQPQALRRIALSKSKKVYPQEQKVITLESGRMHQTLQEASHSYSNSPQRQNSKELEKSKVNDDSTQVFLTNEQGIKGTRIIREDSYKSKDSSLERYRVLSHLVPLKINNSGLKNQQLLPMLQHQSLRGMEGFPKQDYSHKVSQRQKDPLSPSMRLQKAKRQAQRNKDQSLKMQPDFMDSVHRSLRNSLDHEKINLNEWYLEDRLSEYARDPTLIQMERLTGHDPQRRSSFASLISPQESNMHSPDFHIIRTQKYSFNLAEQYASQKKAQKSSQDNQYRFKANEKIHSHLKPTLGNKKIQAQQEARQIKLFQQYSILQGQKSKKQVSQRNVLKGVSVTQNQFKLNPYLTQNSGTNSPHASNDPAHETQYKSRTDGRKESNASLKDKSGRLSPYRQPVIMSNGQVTANKLRSQPGSIDSMGQEKSYQAEKEDAAISPFINYKEDSQGDLEPGTAYPPQKLVNQRTSINHEDQRMMSSTGMKHSNLPKIVRISTKSILQPLNPSMKDMAADADFSQRQSQMKMNDLNDPNHSFAFTSYNKNSHYLIKNVLSPRASNLQKFSKFKKSKHQDLLNKSLQNMTLSPVNNSTVEFSPGNPMRQAIHIQSKEILSKTTLDDQRQESIKKIRNNRENQNVTQTQFQFQQRTQGMSFFRILPSLRSREISPRYQNQSTKNTGIFGTQKLKRSVVSNSVDLKPKMQKKGNSMRFTTELEEINEKIHYSQSKHQTQGETYWAPLESSRNIVLDQKSINKSRNSSEGRIPDQLVKDGHSRNKSNLKNVQGTNSTHAINAQNTLPTAKINHSSKYDSSIDKSQTNSKQKLVNQKSYETVMDLKRVEVEPPLKFPGDGGTFMNSIDVQKLCESKPNLLVPNQSQNGNHQTMYKKRFQQSVDWTGPRSPYSQNADKSTLITPKYLNRDKKPFMQEKLQNSDGFTNRTLAEYMVAQNALKYGGLKKFGVNPLVHCQNASYIQSRDIDIHNNTDFAYTTVTDSIKHNLLKLKTDRKTLEAIIDCTIESGGVALKSDESRAHDQINQFQNSSLLGDQILDESASIGIYDHQVSILPRESKDSQKRHLTQDEPNFQQPYRLLPLIDQMQAIRSPIKVKEDDQSLDLLTKDEKRVLGTKLRMSVVDGHPNTNTIMADIKENEEFLENLTLDGKNIRLEQFQENHSTLMDNQTPKPQYNILKSSNDINTTPHVTGSFIYSKIPKEPLSPASSIFGQSEMKGQRINPKLNIQRNNQKTNLEVRQEISIQTSPLSSIKLPEALKQGQGSKMRQNDKANKIHTIMIQ